MLYFTDDSDYELDKWNEENKRQQEEGDSELEEETGKKSAFIEEEADESDNGEDDNNRYDVDSGSEGDISDGGDSDNSADEHSVCSDDELSVTTSNHKSKKKLKKHKKSMVNLEEKTMDLFCDSRSKGGVLDELSLKNSNTEKDSADSVASLCLRLDSLEEGDDTNFNFPSSLVSTKLNTSINSKEEKHLTNISDISQESRQSIFGEGSRSGFGECTNSLEASSDSSRIPPGQGSGDNNTQENGDRSSDKKTPETFSSFARLRNLIGITNGGDTQSLKKVIGRQQQLSSFYLVIHLQFYKNIFMNRWTEK